MRLLLRCLPALAPVVLLRVRLHQQPVGLMVPLQLLPVLLRLLLPRQVEIRVQLLLLPVQLLLRLTAETRLWLLNT